MILDLSRNSIGDAGATALVAAFPFYEGAQDAVFGYKLIGDAGATAFKAAIPSSTALTRLDLNDDKIGDACVAAISAALLFESRLSFYAPALSLATSPLLDPSPSPSLDSPEVRSGSSLTSTAKRNYLCGAALFFTSLAISTMPAVKHCEAAVIVPIWRSGRDAGAMSPSSVARMYDMMWPGRKARSGTTTSIVHRS